jgi:hypothetical protein
MCTVTYYPGSAGFVLTHNRDESPARSPQNIARARTPGGKELLFPRDTGAGGTWIAVGRDGRAACLLNGAFLRHQRLPPYRRSRGLILLDFFDRQNPDDFFEQYNLDEIEPFTLLYFQLLAPYANTGNQPEPVCIYEFRWDGQQRHLKNLSGLQAHFWCSATLYPPDMQLRREAVFRQWLEQHSGIHRGIQNDILHLHRTGSVGDPENDFVMERAGKVRTVSITQLTLDEKNARMRYFDLAGQTGSERRLKQSERRLIYVNR